MATLKPQSITVQGVSPPMICSFNEIQEKRERKHNNDKYKLSGNTFLCKVKLGKTLQGRESGESASLSLIPWFQKTKRNQWIP